MNISKKLFCNHSKHLSTEVSKKLKKEILVDVPHKNKYFACVNYKRYGKVTTDVIAVNKKTQECEVAMRLVEGCVPLVNVNLNCSYMGGYSFTFKSQEGYHLYRDLKEVAIYTYAVLPVIGSPVYVDLMNWDEDEQLKYLKNYKQDIELNCTYISEFVTYLRVEPKIEYLVKGGLTKYYKEYNKFKGYKITPKRLEVLNRYKLTLNQLKSIERRKISPENYITIREIQDNMRTSYDFELRENIEYWKIAQQIIEDHIVKVSNLYHKLKYLYLDTIKLACRVIHCGVDIDLKDYVLADSNIMQTLHDNLIELNEQVVEQRLAAKAQEEFKIESENIKKQADKNQQLAEEAAKYNGLFKNETSDIKFNVLDSLEEFYKTGTELHHCVYKLHYYDKVIDQESLIINAMINDKITETLEIDLEDKRIIQCRGKWNQDSSYHEEILEQAKKRILSAI